MRSLLHSPMSFRDVTLPNRIVMSPMCQYSAEQGLANDWHLVHLGSRAQGGVGLIMVEATAVTPEGRITPADLGLWNDAQTRALARIVRFLHAQGSVAGIQLAHAGRKGSTDVPWSPHPGSLPPERGGWTTVAPSALPFDVDHQSPRALTESDLPALVQAFADSARRAVAAGFRVIEVHAAHGYLLHQFLSPLSNRRTDAWGGTLEHRCRLPLAVVTAVRDAVPASIPVFVRLSATDWDPDHQGWGLDDTLYLARRLKELEVDLIDVSSGGTLPKPQIPLGPGYQTGFAAQVRAATGLPTGAVGLITRAEQAEHVLRTGQADLVFLGRALLRDPHWALQQAGSVRATPAWPPQYVRAAAHGTPHR